MTTGRRRRLSSNSNDNDDDICNKDDNDDDNIDDDNGDDGSLKSSFSIFASKLSQLPTHLHFCHSFELTEDPPH